MCVCLRLHVNVHVGIGVGVVGVCLCVPVCLCMPPNVVPGGPQSDTVVVDAGIKIEKKTKTCIVVSVFKMQ